MRSSVPVLFPYKLLHTIVPAVAMGMKTAYLFPFASHAEGMIKGWEEVGMPGEYRCYHPSSGEPESAAIDFLKSADPEVIVLDCIGYSSDFGKRVAEETGKSVVLPRTLLVNIAHALLGL